MNRQPEPTRFSVIRWWGQKFLLAERAAALVATGLLAIALLYDKPRALVTHILDDNRTAVYGALSSIFASLLGFTIAAVAIVLSFANSDRLAFVRDSEHYPTIWETFKSCVRWLAIATAMSLVALIVDRNGLPMLPVALIVFYATLVGVARVGRTIWILELLIGIITSRPRE